MILVTGGLGFLGLSLGKYLLDLGEEVLLTRHRNPQIPDMLQPYIGKNLHVAPMEITSLSTVLDAVKKYKVDSIIHAAGTSEKGGSLLQVFGINVNGSANILEAARIMDIARVTFISSEGVNQGRKEATPLKEEEFFSARSDRYIPATKKMAELLFFIYQKEYQMDMVIVRPSRIYGPFYTSGRNPVLRMATAAAKGLEEDLSRVNAKESHDLVYVRDCGRAVAMIHLAKKPKHSIYNVGCGELHSFGEVARALERIVPGTTLKLGTGGFAAITKTDLDINACLDISRISEEFGYAPEYDLEKGLTALVAWVRDGKYI